MSKIDFSIMALLLAASSIHAQCDFEKVGSWSPPHSTTLAADEQHLYLNRGGDVIIADRDLNGEILILGELALPGTIEQILPEGDLLWIVSGDEGIHLVDITDPALPSLISTIDTPGWARDLALQDGYAFIADGEAGLLVVDAWNPSDPFEIGRHSFSEAALDIAVHDDMVYVALGEGGIGAVNISEPRLSQLTSEYATSNPVEQLEAVGEFLFAVMPDFGLTAFSLDPSSTLLEAESLRWSAAIYSGNSATAAFDNQYTYFLSEDDLTLIDISNPNNILPVAWQSLESQYPVDIAVDEDSVFLLVGKVGFSSDQRILEFTRDDEELAKPHPFLASISSTTQPLDLGFRGDYAYVAQGSLGVVDNSDPLNPRLLTSVPTSYGIYDINIRGDYSYHAWDTEDQGTIVNAIDLSNPTDPVVLGPEGYHDPWWYLDSDLAFSNSLAVLATQWTTTGHTGDPLLSFFDLSNPSSPQSVSTPFYIISSRIEMAVKADILFTRGYITESNSGILAIDLSDPQNIEEFGYLLEEIPYAQQLYVMGDLLLLGVQNTLHIADVSNPRHPQLLSSLEIPGFSFKDGLLSHHGDELILGSFYWDAIYRIDLSNPLNPAAPTEQNIGFYPWNIVSGEAGVYVMVRGGETFLLNPSFRSEAYEPLRDTHSSTLPWFERLRNQIEVQGDTGLMFSRNSSYYWLFDLSNTPPIHRYGPFIHPERLEDASVNPPYLYLLSSNQGDYHFQVIDISDLSSPQILGDIPHSLVGPQRIEQNGTHLILTVYSCCNFEHFSLSEPANPQFIALHSFPGDSSYLEDWKLHDDLLLASSSDGLHFMDISDPAGSLQYTLLEDNLLSGKISINFPLAYISAQNSADKRIEIVDISNASVPLKVSSIPVDPNFSFNKTEIFNGLLFQGRTPADYRLIPYPTRIYSLEDPLSPKLVETHRPRLDEVVDFGARDHQILVLDFTGSVSLFDVECSTCRASEDTLCLGEESRFETSLRWWGASRGQGGVAAAAQQSPQSGLFSWQDPENPEMIVKVLDGTDLNDAHWVFAAGATDVGYALSVEDKITGELREYRNELGTPACAVTDTGAFPVDTSQQAPTALARRSHNTTAATELLLHDTRFRLSLEWRGETGATKSAFAIPHSDKGGFFYWTNPDNLEMVVKVLDGREVNGHFWVFAATSSDVEFRLRVEDTETGQVREYFNPLGEAACSVRDTNSF